MMTVNRVEDITDDSFDNCVRSLFLNDNHRLVSGVLNKNNGKYTLDKYAYCWLEFDTDLNGKQITFCFDPTTDQLITNEGFYKHNGVIKTTTFTHYNIQKLVKKRGDYSALIDTTIRNNYVN